MYTTYAEIQALLGNAVESNILEFKRGDELDAIGDSKTKNELVRDVSAFANAGGGTIIYGVGEKNFGGSAMADTILPVSNSKIDDLQLTQIIRTGLEPAFNKFNVKCIAVPGTADRIIVVEVEKADTAHQCRSDQKYYHRVGNQRPPMYDYEIRDVMNRRTAPLVLVKPRIVRTSMAQDQHHYELEVTLHNEGHRTAHYWTLEVILPDVAVLENAYISGVLELPRRTDMPYQRVFEYAYDRNSRNRTAPLLPGQALPLTKANGYPFLRLPVARSDHDRFEQLGGVPIILRLYVDDSRMQETVIPMSEWSRF